MAPSGYHIEKPVVAPRVLPETLAPKMRVLIQRVKRASVKVDGAEVGAIGEGLLIFVGVRAGDDPAVLEWMARKCAQLRVFADAEGKMNRSLLDTSGGALVVSQFTLYGD